MKTFRSNAVWNIAVLSTIGGLASSAQHHREDGPASLLGHESMGKEQRAVCSGSLVVEVEAAALLMCKCVCVRACVCVCVGGKR